MIYHAKLSDDQIFDFYLKISYLLAEFQMFMSTPHPTQTLLTALQLGQLLKAARKRRQLTQSVVGARLGLSQNRVSHLELHPDELSFKQLLAWCAVVGLEL